MTYLTKTTATNGSPKRKFAGLALITAFASMLMLSGGVTNASSHMAAEKDIVDTAVAAGNFTTLVTAIPTRFPASTRRPRRCTAR